MAGRDPRRRTRFAVVVLSVLAGGLSVTALAASAGCGEPARSSAVMRERTPPAPVAPVVRDGVRYEAVHWGKARGLDQNGGYVAAVDPKTGQELWILRVYAIDYDADLEADRLDVFITGLALSEDGRRLIVEDEKDRRFAVDLATREVSVIKAPAAD